MVESSPEEIIEAMVKFMKQTNEYIKMLKTQLDNQQIDIDSLRKRVNKVDVITPDRIINLGR